MGNSTAFLIYRLLNVRGFGPAKVRAMLKTHFGNKPPENRVEIDFDSLVRLLPPNEREVFSCNEGLDKEVWNRVGDDGFEVVSILDENYPEKVRRINGDKLPLLLFYRGNRKLFDAASVGFCGSRHASDKGIGTARDCAEQLVDAGVNVISGYAAGVDLMTHLTALKNGGTTTIVLPEGLFGFRIRKQLRDIWDWNRVLVISEFLPNLTWNAGNAMKRNTTICALSDAMILIEARSKGGSIAAGRKCLELGKPLFATVYGEIAEESEGNRTLLAEGAKPLMRSRDTGRASLKSVNEAIRLSSEGRYQRSDLFDIAIS